MEKLQPGEGWLFLAWLPYFFFNIVGEELLWRGYLLPRQVGVLGRVHDDRTYVWMECVKANGLSDTQTAHGTFKKDIDV